MAVIVLSLFTYFERPDYNLPLFAFIILLWDNAYVKQKTRIWYMIAVSILVDLIWIIYWAATWGGYKNPEASLCNFTIFISVATFIIKIVILILTYLKVDDCKRALGELGTNFKYIFKGPSTGAYDPLE
jgi:hypothetical protein